jgi:hypothetical protein
VTAGPRPEVVYEFPLAETLALSFQRYPCPASGVVSELPRSWGALPLTPVGSQGLLVPVPDGEAVWVGLLAEPRGRAWSVRVVAHLDPHGTIDVLTGRPADPAGEPAVLSVPPRRVLEGIARDDGDWWVLTRVAPGPPAPSCRRLEVRAEQAGGPPERRLIVDLLDPAAFSARTGAEVPPLRPDAPYGGWRLP